MVLLYLWTLGVSVALLVLWARYLQLQRELDQHAQASASAARQHHDTVTALRSSESHDSMVLESIDELIYRLRPRVEGEAGGLEFVSSRVYDLLGYTPHEAAELSAD